MRVAVRYFSRGGNTEKLARAIAKGAGVDALTTDHPLPGDIDILFLGSSVYAHGVDEQIKKFISGVNVRVGKVVNFSTAALVKSTYKQVGKLLEEKGIPQAKEEFYCRGSLGPLHKGRPNAEDLKAAETFAAEIVKS